MPKILHFLVSPLRLLVATTSVLALLLGLMPTCQRAPIPAAEQVRTLYQQDLAALDSALAALENAVHSRAPVSLLQQRFRVARLAYKRIEYLAERSYPVTARTINGPALAEIEIDEDPNRLVPPEGLQVVETFLFPEYESTNQTQALTQVKMLRSSVRRLILKAPTEPLADEVVFEALRLQLFRMVSLGLSGFDAPLSQNSVPEAAASLRSVQTVYALYQPRLPDSAQALRQRLTHRFAAALTYLDQHPDFATFDRLAFLTDFANPLATELLAVQQALGIPIFNTVRPLNPAAATLFSLDAFRPEAYALNVAATASPAQVALGKMLFFDPGLSGNGTRSCASCHQPAKGFTDGLARSLDLHGARLPRNAPTLLNAALQRTLFHDSRAAHLENQAAVVISDSLEMHGSLTELARRLQQTAAYRQPLVDAFPASQGAVTGQDLTLALAAYVRSLTSLNSRFDRYVRGERTLLAATEKQGFNLFMGKAKCGTCHFMPLFNGTVPPGFEKSEAEVIGVPATPDTVKALLDPDEGKYRLHPAAIYRFAFKTPTVRNVALTGPYMHNGVYATLEEVIDFYNRGGGAGLGFDLPGQTLPAEPLGLTPAEKKALIAFLRSLTDNPYGS